MNKALILCYNDAERSLKAARLLLSFDSFEEVVIVDNASREEERNKLQNAEKEAGLTILYSKENKGYGAGNNIGLRYMEKEAPEAVLLMNPDIIPTKKAVDDCLAFLHYHQEIAACSTYMLEKGKKVRNYYDIPSFASTMLGDSYFSRHVASERMKEGYFTCGFVRESFAFYNYAYLRDIGYFDERLFMYNEGASLGYRFREKGYQEAIVLDGEAVIHDHRGAKINRKGFKMVKASRSIYLREYLRTPEWKIKLFNLWWVNVFLK